MLLNPTLLEDEIPVAPKAPYANCAMCPLRDQPVVYGQGPDQTDFAVVVEGPGETEVEQSTPLVGPGSKLLRPLLNQAGLPEGSYWLTQAVMCQFHSYTTKETELKLATACCQDRLTHELADHGVQYVLASGVHPARALGWQGLHITEDRGCRFTNSNGLEVMPTLSPAFVSYQDSNPKNPNTYKDLRADVNRFMVEKLPTPPDPTYTVCETPESAISALGSMRQEVWWEWDRNQEPTTVVLDLETTSLSPFARLLCAGISHTPGQVLIIPGDILNLAEVTNALMRLNAEPGARFSNHNAKFDRKQLMAKWGFTPNFYHDTMFMHWSLDERKKIHSLKKIIMGVWELQQDYSEGLHNYLEELKKAAYATALKDALVKGIKTTPAKVLAKAAAEAVNFGDIPRDILYPYLAKDVDYTLRLTLILNAQLVGGPRRSYYDVLRPTINMLADTEMTGFKLDTKYQAKLDRVLAYLEKRKLRDIRRLVADNPEFTADEASQFNPASTQQLAEFLHCEGITLPLTAKGNPSTGKQVLATISRTIDHPALALVKAIREYRKLRNTYIDPKKIKADDDGRLRPNIHLASGSTGEDGGTIGLRPSFSKPNFGNLPRGTTPTAKLIKKMYRAGHGYSVVQCDYRAAELRLLAWLSGEDYLIDIFRSGQDPHYRTALDLFPSEDTTAPGWPILRSVGKTCNFAYWYNLGSMSAVGTRLDEFNILMSKEELDAIGYRYAALMPKMVQLIETTKREVDNQGYVEDIWGTRRRFGYPSESSAVRASRYRQGVNHKGQSGAAGLTWKAMAALHANPDFNTKYSARIALMVYDSVIAICPTSHVKDVAALMNHTMRQVALDKLGDSVPFATDATAGPSWGELEDVEL